MKFLQVRLQASRASLAELADFYEERLGIDSSVVGETRLEFVPAAGDPFYHFALLVPGNRFEAALAWAAERVQLLPDQESGELVFESPDWQSRASYFDDPAGNILELIAHRGVGETGVTGPFSAAELLGFSELGLVGDVRTIARELEQLDLRLWDGTLEEPGRLAFVGEKARTLILAPEGRGWVPMSRPAETHPVEAVLSGPPAGKVRTLGHRISRQG